MGLTILDAGVVVAILDAQDPHHTAAAEALRAGRDAGDRFVLPASAFAECLVWPWRSGEAAVSTAEAFIDAFPISVMPADRAIGRTAARLRAHQGRTLRLPDALVVATALEADADRILTTDRGWPEASVPVQVIASATQ
ncbi:MAG: PIN domain-containing protein [Chloroflexi bacterium]|nr:PIN domain-containing protein [Chloroflexota bacterium]